MKVSLGDLLERSRQLTRRSEDVVSGGIEALAHGSMTLELINAGARQDWFSRKRDALYIVVAGHADFERAGERSSTVRGEAIFVRSGESHRFMQMSEGFAAWCVLWGADGGEEPAPAISVYAPIDA